MSEDLPKEKHDHEALDFPENFLWGAATSAHQVEGNNVNNDWWDWEESQEDVHHRSRDAANHYELYEEDFKMVKELGHNAHRLSIEWSRIEPIEGKFDEAAIQHYVNALKTLKSHGITVMLTLWHFTNPLWFAKKGGWLNLRSSDYFARFVKRVVPEIKDYVDLWITLNEPSGYSFDAYGRGKFPPQKKSKLDMLRANWNFSHAHNKAYKIIHQLIPNAKVGISHNIHSFNILHKHSLKEAMAAWGYDLLYNHAFYIMTGKKTHDFLGINYYYNWYISFNGESHIPSLMDIADTKKDVSDLGWEIYPPGIFDVLMDLSDYHLPIYITENGIASTNDDRRVRFLLSYLQEIYHAIATGVKVKGYFHWSLMDNFEWSDGFKPRFGLVEIDYPTQKRTPRPSAYVYKEIIKNNGIPHKLLKLLGHGIQVEEVINTR